MCRLGYVSESAIMYHPIFRQNPIERLGHRNGVKDVCKHM